MYEIWIVNGKTGAVLEENGIQRIMKDQDGEHARIWMRVLKSKIRTGQWDKNTQMIICVQEG